MRDNLHIFTFCLRSWFDRIVLVHGKTITIRYPGGTASYYCQRQGKRKNLWGQKGMQRVLIRPGDILSGNETVCYACMIIPNPFHLFLRSGTFPIATVMQRLLTGYAMYFNRRNRRHGHLFQNRYK